MSFPKKFVCAQKVGFPRSSHILEIVFTEGFNNNNKGCGIVISEIINKSQRKDDKNVY